VCSTLAERARIERRPTDEQTLPAAEGRCLFLVAAAPVTDRHGVVIGCLYGGILLNGNLALVDRIREIIYGNETFQGIEVGSATIFIEDLRVATTIRLSSGERALGTRLSA
jgi:hypothetical protein